MTNTKNNKNYIKPDALDLKDFKHSMVFIDAPPGYGKIALAKYVYQRAEGENFWCDFSNCDNDSLIIHALIKGFRIKDIDPLSIMQQKEAFLSCFSSVISTIQKSAKDSKQPTVVVTGLFDRAYNEYWPYVSHLFSEISQHARLVVATHVNENTKLLHWLDAQKGVLIPYHKLMFSDSEAQSLHEKITAEYSIPVSMLTWPYAYVSVANTIENGGDLAECKEAIYAYFNDSYLDRLNETDRMTLNAACITDDFDIEFIVKALEDPNAPHSVKRLIKLGLLDKQDQSFLLKPQFRSCVFNEFQFMNWKVRKGIKQRAAYYWADKKQYEKALRFCQRYELWESASSVLLSCAEEYINAGRFEKLHKWFEALPSGYIDSNPLLMVYRVWCFPEYQKINGAEVYLDQIAKLLQEEKDSGERKQWLKANVQLQALRGYICRIAGDFEGALQFAQRAVILANEGCPEMLSRLYITIGQDFYLKGDMIDAKSSLMQALTLGKQYKKHHDVLIALGYAIAAMEFTGSVNKAKKIYQETLIWFEESGFIASEGGDLVNDLTIDIHRQLFEFEQALTLSDKMVAWCEGASPALYHLVTYLRRYRLAISMDNRAEAYNALTQAEAFRDVLDVSLAFGWAPVAAMRAEYELRYGSLNKASEYFEAREASLQLNADFSNECERLIYAQWLAACDRQADARNQLVFIREQALSAGRWMQAIRADVQLCLLLNDTDPAGAILHLRDALQTVPENEDIVAPFLWYGKKIIPLLDQVRSQLYQDLGSIQLLNKIKQHASELWPEHTNVNLLNVLSERQVTILKCLVEGDQDKIIAKKLDISPGTVKTHLRAIYRKLNCGNRAQAVSIAMEHGLLLLPQKAAE